MQLPDDIKHKSIAFSQTKFYKNLQVMHSLLCELRYDMEKAAGKRAVELYWPEDRAILRAILALGNADELDAALDAANLAPNPHGTKKAPILEKRTSIPYRKEVENRLHQMAHPKHNLDAIKSIIISNRLGDGPSVSASLEKGGFDSKAEAIKILANGALDEWKTKNIAESFMQLSDDMRSLIDEKNRKINNESLALQRVRDREAQRALEAEARGHIARYMKEAEFPPKRGL